VKESIKRGRFSYRILSYNERIRGGNDRDLSIVGQISYAPSRIGTCRQLSRRSILWGLALVT